MESLTVCILNYKRPQNLTNHILPTLEKNPAVALIVVAHGLESTTFDQMKPLKQNHYILKDKVLHVGNYDENTNWGCWRRWALIKLLVERQIIKTTYILVQDDDIMFPPHALEQMLKAHQLYRGILISGAPGRNTQNGTYNWDHVSGPCEIVTGRAILTKTDTICNAVSKADTYAIPALHKQVCDDICMSFLTLNSLTDYTQKRHYSIDTQYVDLDDSYGLCIMDDHLEKRNDALKFFLNAAKSDAPDPAHISETRCLFKNITPKVQRPTEQMQETKETQETQQTEPSAVTRKRNLLFTSAGHNSKFTTNWTSPNQTYDIYVIYYGTDETIYQNYKAAAKWIEKRAGSKFQNFHYFYHHYKHIIDTYERFFILDDDIIITASDINTMFELSYRYNLSICAPSFSNKTSIAAHPITIHRPDVLLQYTNFVEVNTPLFSAEAIHNLMRHYDGSLVGAGIDYIAIWSNDRYADNKYAIIHSIQAINPSTESKQLQTRELYSVPNIFLSWSERWTQWTAYAKRIHCPEMWHHVIFSTVDLQGAVYYPPCE